MLEDKCLDGYVQCILQPNFRLDKHSDINLRFASLYTTYARAGLAFLSNISKYAWNQVPASGAGLKAEALPQKPS